MYEVLVARVRYHIQKADFMGQKADFMGLKEAESTLLLKEAADAIDELLHIHQMDLSELVLLRRQLQALMEESEAPHA